MTEKGPYTARAGQLVHLKTDFYFLLKNTDHIGDLLQELHPTPAVCGLPKEEAFRFIPDNEGTTAVIIPDSPAGWTQRGIPISTSICAAWK